jgi:hypothetical protein
MPALNSPPPKNCTSFGLLANGRAQENACRSDSLRFSAVNGILSSTRAI